MRAVLLRVLVGPMALAALPALSYTKVSITSIPGFIRATLKNGMRVVVLRNILAPVVTTRLSYLVGSNESPPGFPGMTHAQEHMMFRGSKELTPPSSLPH